MVRDSFKNNTKRFLNKDFIEVDVEPNYLHESIAYISQHNKTISNNSQLLQNIDKSDNIITG